MEPVKNEQTLRYSAFMTMAQALARDWKDFTYAINDTRQSQDSNADMNELYGAVYSTYAAIKKSRNTSSFTRNWTLLFSPELSDSIRLSCAMKVIKDIYVIIPDE